MSFNMISVRAPFAQDFLDSSERLSASEFDIATEFIRIGTICIPYLDRLIGRASSTEYKDLIVQRDETVQQVLQYKNATRAIRRIPPEIVSQFLLLARPYMDYDDFEDPPWRLGHICRYWRDVALSTPELWAEIVIMSPERHPEEKFRTLMSRSSNAPLKVMFWSSYTTGARTKDLLRRLVSCSHRWTSASLVVLHADWPLLLPLRDRIPSLYFLRIGVTDWEFSGRAFFKDAGGDNGNTMNPFEIAPSLRDVTIEDLSALKTPLTLPFKQLTRFKVSTSHRTITSVLTLVPNLEVASLDFTDDPPASGSQIIRLPHLRRIYVSDQTFLNQLELPALKEIFIVGTDPAPLLSIVKRSPSIKLHTLRVAGCNPSHIARILEACPTIEVLCMQLMPGNKGNVLLNNLTVQSTSTDNKFTTIGPNIHTIGISVDSVSVKYELFVRMAESRWQIPDKGSPCCRLRSVELLLVKPENELESPVTQRLDSLRDQGLRVSIVDGGRALDAMMDWRI
ncbi:hypothetical protein R3P38DRAFT_2843941 [Favolaschia claudopus]|uniref:F-box domain-containing protein n=1 Tax=Favolaschia claudopus TaxID=2862362 RepID=A0AAW0E1H2_9AGAR